MVAVVGLVTLFGLAVTYRDAMRSHESEKRSQIRVDYSQKEDAFLRALVAIVPNRAIDAMRDGSRARAADLSWEAIFRDAVALANAETSVSADVLKGFGLESAVLANPGDQELNAVGDLVTAVVGGNGFVNPGITQSATLLLDSRFQDRLPDPLEAASGVALDDQVYPIISNLKTFSSAWNTEADVSVADYPLYNRILYPNVQFGLAAPGSRFVAKRNWWAFSVTLGGQGASTPDTGDANAQPAAPLLTKNYVFSIYEMPSQHPIAADTFMKVGKHSSGGGWQNVQIRGGVNGTVLETEGTLALPSGRVSGRRSMTLSSGTSAEGQLLRNDFDALGVREVIAASSNAGGYGASLSANSGRVAFVPINRGLDFYALPVVNEVNTISPTTWDRYSTGAVRCPMKVMITKVQSLEDQMPTRLEFRFQGTTGEVTATFERGVNWPYPNQPGGSTVPFQTEHTESGRKALVVLLQRLPVFLAANGGAPLDQNQALLISHDPSRDANIQPTVFPTVETETVTVVREAADLTAWAKGLSVVANMRLYFSDDFNIVATPAPAGAAVPTSEPFYPPVSVFATEKRYGTTLKTRPVELKGQVGTLAQGEILPLYPLDLKAGTHETVNESLISADLKPIVSPAQLPPIYLMNWLITVEEIH